MSKKSFSKTSPSFSKTQSTEVEAPSSTIATAEVRSARALAAQHLVVLAAAGYPPEELVLLGKAADEYEVAYGAWLDMRQRRKRLSTVLRAEIVKGRKLRRRLLLALRMLNIAGVFDVRPAALPSFPMRMGGVLAWYREVREGLRAVASPLSAHVPDPLGQLDALAASTADALGERESTNRRLTSCRLALHQAKLAMALQLASLRAAVGLAFQDQPEVVKFFYRNPGSRSRPTGAANDASASSGSNPMAEKVA